MEQSQIQARRNKGLDIANKESQIKRIDEFNYDVLSQNGMHAWCYHYCIVRIAVGLKAKRTTRNRFSS